MNLTPRQQQIVVDWVNRAIARTPFAVVPRQELKHEVRGSLGRYTDWYQRSGLILSLLLGLLPYRYRLLLRLARQGSGRAYRWNNRQRSTGR